MVEKFNIWEGVYSSFNEVPSSGEGFESSRWIDSNYKKTKEILDNLTSADFVNEVSKFNISPLSVVISLMKDLKRKIKVLDFGGGMGTTYLQVKEALITNDIDFTIVEGIKNCEKANALFSEDDNINFYDKLPLNEEFDIIHISSSLQYIEDWKGLLSELCQRYNAKTFIFNDLPAGDIKSTYATYQNYYESKIPYWFFKIDDVINEVKKYGFELIHKSNFVAKILGDNEKMPQDNFSKNYQVGYAKNLIFEKLEE